MLATVLGWFFIATGIVFFLYPQVVRDKILKKSSSTLRRNIPIILIFAGILLIRAVMGHVGCGSKIITAIGIICALKGFLLVTPNLTDRIIEWLIRRNLIFFKICAIIYLFIGIMLIINIC